VPTQGVEISREAVGFYWVASLHKLNAYADPKVRAEKCWWNVGARTLALCQAVDLRRHPPQLLVLTRLPAEGSVTILIMHGISPAIAINV
jgi:hypothetical protein